MFYCIAVVFKKWTELRNVAAGKLAVMIDIRAPFWEGLYNKGSDLPHLAPSATHSVPVTNDVLMTVLSGPVSGKEHGGNTSALHTATVLSGPVSGKEHGGNGSSLDTVPVLQSVIIFCLLHIYKIFRLRSSALLWARLSSSERSLTHDGIFFLNIFPCVTRSRTATCPCTAWRGVCHWTCGLNKVYLHSWKYGQSKSLYEH